MAVRGARRNRLRTCFRICRAVGGPAAAWSHPALVSNAFPSSTPTQTNRALAPRRPDLVVVFILGKSQQTHRVHHRGDGRLLFAEKKIAAPGAGRRRLS